MRRKHNANSEVIEHENRIKKLEKEIEANKVKVLNKFPSNLKGTIYDDFTPNKRKIQNKLSKYSNWKRGKIKKFI